MEALKPLLSKHDCTFVLDNEVMNISGLFFRKSTGTLYCCESGEQISTSTMTQETVEAKGMSPSQTSGSSSSFGDKYLCGKMFCIDDTKDADSTNTHQKEDKAWLNKNTPQYKKAVQFIKDGGDVNLVLSKYKMKKEIKEELENLNK